ncbi:MAG TPA: DUF1116 domain-containing protein, partial [Actinomycetota bacterium]|nr:DUF1116 domain-containing protein [Actinomycetota bacterium]
MSGIPLPSDIGVVNLGLSLFGDAVREQGRPVVQVDWRIPADGDPALVAALSRLFGRNSASIDEANAEVARRLDEGSPKLVRIEQAAKVVPGVDDRTILHSGPAIAWGDMADPLRRSVRAAVMAEGWADSPDEVDKLLGRDEVRLEPANHHDAVVPMASAIGPTAPMLVVENEAGGTRAFSSMNQG